jgi:hypothetical protein
MKLIQHRNLKLLITWTHLGALFFGMIVLGLQRLPIGDFITQFHTFGNFQAAEIERPPAGLAE